jgi:hypothetical protein
LIVFQVSLPIRFLVFIATPTSDHDIYESGLDLGRMFGVLLTDEVSDQLMQTIIVFNDLLKFE